MAGLTAVEPTSGKVEAALAHLQPIRDLAKNWDIDIASCLQDYLNELVGHLGGVPPASLSQENIDGSEKGPPNFAQAALLLHNSSHVYSKKVNYLHSLVYAALNELVSSSGQKQHANRHSTADASVEEFEAFDPDTEFLLLDDVLPMFNAGNKLNLVDDDSDESMFLDHGADGNRLSTFSTNAVNGDGTRLSLGGLSVTRLDRSAAMQNIPSTITATRALMGSIFNEGTDTAGGNLRLLSGRCDVNDGGIFLMPGSGILGNQRGDRDVRKSLDMSGRDVSVNSNANNDDVPMQEPMDIDYDGGFAFDNDDDDNEGPGFQLADGDGAVTMNEQPAPSAVNPLTTQTAVELPRPDPWALLDPHDAGTAKPRPIRIGITYRLPPGLEEPPSSCVTGASTRRTTIFQPVQQQRKPRRRQRLCIASETFEAAMAAERHRRETRARSLGNADKASVISNELVPESRSATFDSVPLKGLVFGDEFAYVAKAQAKLKAADKRERRKLLMNNPDALPQEEADNLLGFDDHGDGGGMDFGGDDDSFGGGYEDNVDADGAHVGNTGIASIDDAFSTWGENDQDMSNPDAATFEALCRAHIKAFAKGAERYAAETNLTKRVGHWQQKLAPILEEQEQRPEFNIQIYGDRVIHAMKEEISKRKIDSKTRNLDSTSTPSKDKISVDFHAVTQNCEQYEVCRLFLVSLMLSNSGNVALSHNDGADVANSTGSLQMELLESEVDYPMETYLAPSAMEQEGNNP